MLWKLPLAIALALLSTVIRPTRHAPQQSMIHALDGHLTKGMQCLLRQRALTAAPVPPGGPAAF